MPFRSFLALLTLAVSGVPFVTSAQQVTGPAQDAAVTYLERNWNRHGLASEDDVQNLIITDAVRSRRSGATSVYLHQGIDGIPVVDGQMTISVDENGRVFHATGQLVPELSSRTKTPSSPGIDAAVAVNSIAQKAGFPPPEPFRVVEQELGSTRKTLLTDGGNHTDIPVMAKLAYIVENGALRLVWEATLFLHGADGAWQGLVDAFTGEVLRLQDVLYRDKFSTWSESPLIVKEERVMPGLVPHPLEQQSSQSSECYKVFAWPLTDPFHADPSWPEDGRTWECDPFDPVASPGGWHDDNGDGSSDHTITRGNNVHAYADWTSSPPPEPDGGTDLHFDFPIDFDAEPEEYVNATVTNLFYWNNIVHDVMLHYGFDEAHGNFQAYNYTNEGEGGDYVNARAQSNNEIECTNAFFSSPLDGYNPTMRMLLGCNHTPKMDGSFDNHVVVHEYGHGITDRMTGGPNNTLCLQNAEQMGEGWSDWYGLMFTMDENASNFGRDQPRPVGVFLFHDDAPSGVREAPYTTNFQINDYTYGDTVGMLSWHSIGFVWATILWEVTWDLIETYGYEQEIANADVLAGNTIMMNLVTEALNLQPCSPGFVDGRDAIFAAIDGVYSDQPEQWRENLNQLMWEGFARRGLGYFADQGSYNQLWDNVEDFIVPSDITPKAISDLASESDGDFVTLTWTAPSDDDSDVYNYHLRYASSPILDEDDWDAATVVEAVEEMIPKEPGEMEEIVVTNLDFETTYHFVIRSDDGLNTSGLSNPEKVTTLSAPVANVPLDPIEVTIEPDGKSTVDFTFSNVGPSTLRYGVSFTETTSGVQGKQAPHPDGSNDNSERNIAIQRNEEGTSPQNEPQQLLGEGGPDAYGYRWVDSNALAGPTYDWIDITDGNLVTLYDDDQTIVDLPFDFPFYGNTYNWIAIQSNGVLTFEDGIVYSTPPPIPSTYTPNAILAAYWDDLNPAPNIEDGGSIYHKTLDDGRFIVSWNDVPHVANRGSFTFQIVLDPTGAIRYQYKEIAPDSLDEDEAVVGIESPDGTDGLQVVYKAPYVQDELVTRFWALWVESNVTGGQVAADSDETLTLTFEVTNLEPGVYTANMIIGTNETVPRQLYTVPLRLSIGAIDTETEELDFEGTHRLSAIAPNPVYGTATVTLEVAEAQDMRVELFDVRGRKVATAFEGALSARTAEKIELDGSRLAPGVYVLRISGETFAEARRVTVVR